MHAKNMITASLENHNNECQNNNAKEKLRLDSQHCPPELKCASLNPDSLANLLKK